MHTSISNSFVINVRHYDNAIC